MKCAEDLPAAPDMLHPWRFSVTSISFELIGATPLSWNLEDAAEEGLRGINQFFAHAGKGAARRARWKTIILLVPFNKNKEPALVKLAWERAIG